MSLIIQYVAYNWRQVIIGVEKIFKWIGDVGKRLGLKASKVVVWLLERLYSYTKMHPLHVEIRHLYVAVLGRALGLQERSKLHKTRREADLSTEVGLEDGDMSAPLVRRLVDECSIELDCEIDPRFRIGNDCIHRRQILLRLQLCVAVACYVAN